MSRRRSVRGEAGKRVARTLERLMLQPDQPAPVGPVFDLEAAGRSAPGYPVTDMGPDEFASRPLAKPIKDSP